MLKGFKEFVLRGNIFELAVAVVIGTAFTAVVTSVVTNLINPVIAVFGGNNINGLSVQLNSANPKTIVQFDAVLTAIINFLVIAVVVYFAFVLPVQRIMARRRQVPDEEVVAVTDTELLAEIRDLLREQRAGGEQRGGGQFAQAQGYTGQLGRGQYELAPQGGQGGPGGGGQGPGGSGVGGPGVGGPGVGGPGVGGPGVGGQGPGGGQGHGGGGQAPGQQGAGQQQYPSQATAQYPPPYPGHDAGQPYPPMDQQYPPPYPEYPEQQYPEQQYPDQQYPPQQYPPQNHPPQNPGQRPAGR